MSGFEIGSAIISTSFKILGGLLGVFLVQVLTKALYNVYLHPLRSFPGPKLNAASSIPHVLSTLRGQVAVDTRAQHEKYGHVVRTSPNELVFCDGTAAKDIYTRRAAEGGIGKAKGVGPGMRKSTLYYNSPPRGPRSILAVTDEGDHARMRRLLSHAFSEKALREQEPLIKTYVDLLIKRLLEKAEEGPQDMVRWYNFVAFDIIGDLTMGESFQCLESSTLHPWVSFLYSNFKGATFLTVARRFPLISKVLLKMMPQKAIQQRVQHHQFSKEKVLKRIKAETDRKDFMQNVLKHNDDASGMSTDEIVSTFGILLLAGSETTATLLAVVTYFLLQNPRVMKKLVEEIRSSFHNEEEITMVSVNGLKYELAVLDEALRIHPPTPLGSPRVVPPEGEIISGQWVPGGTTVIVSTYSANRQSRNWKDSDAFIPERWLGDAEYASDDKSAFAPFSLGTRNCIGRNLAYAEMRLILARLLWNFDLELMEKSVGWAENMKMFNLWEKPPLFVKLTPVHTTKK